MAAVLTAALIAWLDPAGVPKVFLRYAPRAFATAGLLSLLLVAFPRRRARGPDAPCARCGYDLTGNVSGVCPECGTPTPQGLIDRWRDEAERIEHLEEAEESVNDVNDRAGVVSVEAAASGD